MKKKTARKSAAVQTKPKRKLQTYVITETITIEQEIPGWSEEDALEKYRATMDDHESRFILTTEGCTSTSSTTSEIEVENLGEADCD